MTLPDYLKRLIDAADDLPLRHRMPQATATARRSAVLILFGEGPQGPDVLLIEKSAHLRSHAGQPAFPGGGVDPGDDFPIGTALREAEEEAGIDPAGVRVLATLQELFLPPSNRLVVPVVAWWDDPRDVTVGDPHEVARVARVPLADLTDPANRYRLSAPRGLHRAGVLRRRHGGVGLHRRPARRDPRGRRPGPAVGHDRRPAAVAVGDPAVHAPGIGGRRRSGTTPRRRSPIPRPTALRRVPFPRDERATAGVGWRRLRWSCCLALLAGCGGDDSPGTSAAPTTADGVGEVTVAPDGVQEITLQTQDDYVFTPDHFTVDPGTVRAHRGERGEADDPQLHVHARTRVPRRSTRRSRCSRPGEEMTIDFDVEAPGDYPFECSFHVQLGQVGTMTVRG